MPDPKRDQMLDEAVRSAAAALRQAMEARGEELEGIAARLEEIMALARWDREVVSTCQGTAKQLRAYAQGLRQEGVDAEKRMLPREVQEEVNHELADDVAEARAKRQAERG